MQCCCRCDCLEDSDDEDSTSYSYGFTDDPEDDAYIPIEMKDYLPKDYDPMEEYYKAYVSLIREDHGWNDQPESVKITEMNGDELLDSARSLVSESDLTPRFTRGLNLFLFLICKEKDYEKRRPIIAEYETLKMKIELATNQDFQDIMTSLMDARDDYLDVSKRVHAFHKALFNCSVKSRQNEIQKEYEEYCESVKKK